MLYIYLESILKIKRLFINLLESHLEFFFFFFSFSILKDPKNLSLTFNLL